jgi:hypothetical protein
MKKSINLKVVGYLATETIGNKIVFHSNKVFKTKKEAIQAVNTHKEAKMWDNILKQASIVADLHKLREYMALCRSRFSKYVAKLTIKKYIQSIGRQGVEFLKDFFQESKFFLKNGFQIVKNQLVISSFDRKFA